MLTIWFPRVYVNQFVSTLFQMLTSATMLIGVVTGEPVTTHPGDTAVRARRSGRGIGVQRVSARNLDTPFNLGYSNRSYWVVDSIQFNSVLTLSQSAHLYI
jgi:hypothetical protein